MTLQVECPQTGPFSHVNPENWENENFPRGANYIGNDVGFAVFSKNAHRILLEIYETKTGTDAKYCCWMVKNKTDNIWRAKLKRVPKGTIYAFRSWGPNWPFHLEWKRGNSSHGYICDVDGTGNRFNPNKVLFDPYAREMTHDKEVPEMAAAGENGGMYGTGSADYNGVTRREVDTGRWAPKGYVIKDATKKGVRPKVRPEKAVIYEAHVRGLTKHESAARLGDILKNYAGFEEVTSVPNKYRGTYKGAAYIAKYLKAMGYTTIELLPVHETDNDMNPEGRAGGNYWGYMTFGFFAPDRRYSYDKKPGGPTKEFKQMVKAFHDEGLEVYLDVVFNHTGEGGNWGDADTTGFVSFGGFDCAEYYHLTGDGKWLVSGATGCGNQLNFSNEVCCDLVLDSLQYWLKEMGVDGFRFDLAPVLGRKPEAAHPEDWAAQANFHQDHPLLEDILDIAYKYDAEMIAEAWDLWGYHVGSFPKGWGEWNGRYRDSIRTFLKGGKDARHFINMMNGDYEKFADNGGPHRSINFITAHDGFTLMDLVSYNSKNNHQAWPFGPSDGGSNDNDSWNSGGNHALRRQRLRNFTAIQFLSRGVPMVVWGDEYGRTQNGNNNPYNLDSVATWNNYDMIGTNAPHLIPLNSGQPYHNNFGTAASMKHINSQFAFSRYMSQLRKQRPALKQNSYADLKQNAGNDVSYVFRAPDAWRGVQSHDRCIWLRIDGSGIGDNDLLVLINMYHEPVRYNVPDESDTQKWVRLVDTAAWAESVCNCWQPHEAEQIHYKYYANPWSVVVLEELQK